MSTDVEDRPRSPGGETETQLAIEARDLVKTYPGGVRALDGLGFAVAAGTVFGLLGPNGAGKSTTVKILWAGMGIVNDLDCGVMDHFLVSPARRSALTSGVLVYQGITSAVRSLSILSLSSPYDPHDTQ